MTSIKRFSILIVDDVKAELYRYEDYLQALGHDTETTDNVTESLALLKKKHFDLLITDIHLVDDDDSNARRDGIELIRRRGNWIQVS